MAMHVSLCDGIAVVVVLSFGDQSWGCRSLELPLYPCLEQFVCTVRILPEEQNELDAAFSLCHTHSAITFWTWWGRGRKRVKP